MFWKENKIEYQNEKKNIMELNTCNISLIFQFFEHESL